MMGLLAAALLVSGQKTVPSLEETVRGARTQAIAPRSEPPAWMDYERLRAGYALMRTNGRAIVQVLGTSSFAATFAARDVTPVLNQTGRLPHEFTQRMSETEAQMVAILLPPASREAFLKRGYGQAVSLGTMHAAVAEAVKGPLRWNPQERVPMNGQSYAFVLYTFAWWPVEALIAQKAVDPEAQAKELDDWFHLWSVVGYGMGVPEGLLPRDYATASHIVALLRKAQYAKRGERLPEGIPTLLGGHVRHLTARAKGTDASKGLADMIALSPGLGDALGLGTDPAARLAAYAAAP